MNIIKAMHENNTIIKMQNEESAELQSKIGLQQGCVQSPLLVLLVLDDAITKTKQKNVGTRTMETGNNESIRTAICW